MIKQYEQYKDNGIEWIKAIPEHWSSVSIKYLANGGDTMFNDGNWIESDIITDSGIRYITSGNIGPGYFKEQGNGFVSEETFINYNFTEVFAGDLLISRLNEPIGRACIIPDLGNRIVTCVDNVILRPKAPFNKQYLMYLMNSKEYSNVTSLISRGATMKRISRGLLGQIKIPVPSGKEQIKIAQYLDHQTDIIDQLIQKKEKLIELLKEKRQAIINEAVTKGLNPNTKMKESGIQGVGKIPNHWYVKRLKQITDAFGRIGYRGYTTSDIVSEGEGAITISPSNMKGDYMTFEDSTYISWEKYEESPEIQIFNNDVLMVKTGSTYGKVGLVKNLNEKATINPQVLVFKNLKVNPDYLFNLLRTPLIKNQIETNVIGSTIPTMSQTKILNFQIVIPPASEIEEILSYINNSMVMIDHLNRSIFTQIEKLKEYRQSIISEAVTGKIDVREWQPNKQQVA